MSKDKPGHSKTQKTSNDSSKSKQSVKEEKTPSNDKSHRRPINLPFKFTKSSPKKKETNASIANTSETQAEANQDHSSPSASSSDSTNGIAKHRANSVPIDLINASQQSSELESPTNNNVFLPDSNNKIEEHDVHDEGEVGSAAARAMRSRTFSLSKSGRVKEVKPRSMTVSNCFDVDLEF